MVDPDDKIDGLARKARVRCFNRAPAARTSNRRVSNVVRVCTDPALLASAPDP